MTTEPATLSPVKTGMRNPAGLSFSEGILKMYHYPKKFLSAEQLLKKMIDSEMTISSRDEAETALMTIGYYRLKGYSFQLIDAKTKKYITGTDFSNVLRLYHFDSELSHLTFNYLSQIEIGLRASLIDAFKITNDALVLNDSSVFKDKQLYWKNQSSIASEISRSNDVFIEHNYNRHEGAVPIWAAVEVMSFGTLSKLIKNLKTGKDSVFSALIQKYRFKNNHGLINPSKDMFTSWVQATVVMRNICAHNSRIYNRAISMRPQLLSADLIEPQPKYNGFYQIVLAMKYLRPSDELWLAFLKELQNLLGRYEGVYDIAKLNFPLDWKKHMNI